MYYHKFILIDVIQMLITWFYIYLCIIWRIYFGEKLYVEWKNHNRFFGIGRKCQNIKQGLLGIHMWV